MSGFTNKIDNEIISLRDNVTIARIDAKAALEKQSYPVASVSTQTEVTLQTETIGTQTDPSPISAPCVESTYDGKKKRKQTDGDIVSIAKRTRSSSDVYWIRVIDIIKMGYGNIPVEHRMSNFVFRVDGDDGDEEVWLLGDYLKRHILEFKFVLSDYWVRSDFVEPLWEILSRGTLEDHDDVKYVERLGIDKLQLE